MTMAEAHHLLRTDPSFVYAKRFDFSIDALLDRYPDGCPPHVIAGALLMTEEDVENMHAKIVAKLREYMGV